MQLLIEAIIVSVALVVIGLFISFIFMGDQAKDFQYWDRIAAMLFISGILTHLFFELTGLNKMYCTKGYACQEK